MGREGRGMQIFLQLLAVGKGHTKGDRQVLLAIETRPSVSCAWNAMEAC